MVASILYVVISTTALFTFDHCGVNIGSFQVITVVFQYFAMLRANGVSSTVYNEIKVTEDNEFRWKEQVMPPRSLYICV